jgi:hypothetical protein
MAVALTIARKESPVRRERSIVMSVPTFGSSRARTFLAAALFAVAALAYGPAAHACACCAEPGQRVETSTKLEPYEKGELQKVRFTNKARLYMTDAGAAGIQGVTDPTDTYELTQSLVGERWTFSFKDTKGRTGSLTFTLPAKIESFFGDPQDGKPDTEPVLYKEWRLTAPVTAAGVFAPASATGAPTIRLVLQGRGNSCTSAGQFTRYSLIVSGPSARFTLFGALASPAP